MTSRFEIDRDIKSLIGKLVDGTISDTQKGDLQHLQRQRVNVMKPSYEGLKNKARRGRNLTP